jgi:2-methylisocitrate lyase-like PEP mutase family enzyme
VVQAVTPKPINLLSVGLPVATAAAWGVRRISLGGALAALSFNHLLAAAKEIAEHGTFGEIAKAPRGQLNAIMAEG